MVHRTFDNALAEHLEALQSRDIERFSATVGDDVCVVDGRGSVMRGRPSVLQSHAQWFASADPWTFNYTVALRPDLGDAGLALIDVTYRQTPAAHAGRFLLSLVFERSNDGTWQCVFDQNIPLAPPRD